MDTSRKKGKHSIGDDQPSETLSHLFATLKAAVELQKRKAMYEPDHMVGILFFNVVRILGYWASFTSSYPCSRNTQSLIDGRWEKGERKVEWWKDQAQTAHWSFPVNLTSQRGVDTKYTVYSQWLVCSVHSTKRVSMLSCSIFRCWEWYKDARAGGPSLESKSCSRRCAQRMQLAITRPVGTSDHIIYFIDKLDVYRAPKAATKRVFLITDEDEPHGGSVQLDRIAKQNLAVSYDCLSSIFVHLNIFRIYTHLGWPSIPSSSQPQINPSMSWNHTRRYWLVELD